MQNRARALLGLMVLAGAATGTLLACSDDDSGASATTDAGTDARTDGASNGPTCADAGAPACTAAACTEQFGGDAGFCVEGQCVQAITQDCTRVGGDLTGANQIVIGASLAIAATGSGPSRVNSLELAINEINANGGIPGPDSCSPARTLAFVQCDDFNPGGADAGTDRIRGTQHLVQDLKVPVVVGASTSGATLDLAGNVVIPAGAMLFAPSSTAIAITNPSFNASPNGTRLLWRAAPSDTVQSIVLQKVYAQIEAIVKGSGTPKVALVTKNDAYGAGIRTNFSSGLLIDGAAPTGANFLDAVYQDPANTKTVTNDPLATVINAVKAFNPNIVVLVGTDELVTDDVSKPTKGVLPQLEAANIHPYYLAADGVKKPALTTTFDDIDSTNSVQARFRGTQPGVVTQQLTQNFFNFGYKNAYGANSVLSYGMAGAYDIGYMLAYAIAASKGAAVTGTSIAKNMQFLVGGSQEIDVGTASLSKGFTAMLAGTAVDFNGASGRLDFDLTTGEAPSDYSVWCVKRDPNNTSKHIYNEVAGLSYDAKTQALTGTYDCPVE